MLSAWRWSRS